MKVIVLNGSSRVVGNTSNIVLGVIDDLGREGIEAEQVQLYDYSFEPCNDCRSCEMRGDGRCMNEDDGMNDILDNMRSADGIIIASPAYAGAVPGVLRLFLERASLCLEKGDRGLRGKIGAVITVSEHDGAETAFNEITDWMLRCEMVVVGACPFPVFRALNSPAYEKDEGAMKGLKRLMENYTSLLSKISDGE